MSQLYTIHTLTETLGCSPKKVYNTIQQHKDQFVEYQDYIKIFGPAIKEYKEQGIIPKSSKGKVTLWSEEGFQKLKQIIFPSQRQKRTADTTKVFTDAVKTFERAVNVIVEQGKILVQEKDRRIELLERLIKDKDKQLQEKKEQISDLKKDKETYRSVTTQLVR